MIHRSVLTTFQIQHCIPSMNTTETTLFQRMTSSTMFTVSYMHRVTESSLQTIYQKCYLISLMLQTSVPFSDAGKTLAELHLNYETCEKYPHLKVAPRKSDLFWEEKPEHFLLGTKPMKYKDKDTKDTLFINDHVQIEGIPEEAHRYVVNGRTPLEWFINRYKITPPEKNKGILNDVNGWFENPRDLVTAIERIVYVSVESARIIDGLPNEITAE